MSARAAAKAQAQPAALEKAGEAVGDHADATAMTTTPTAIAPKYLPAEASKS